MLSECCYFVDKAGAAGAAPALKNFLLYFALPGSIYTEFGTDPKNISRAFGTVGAFPAAYSGTNPGKFDTVPNISDDSPRWAL